MPRSLPFHPTASLDHLRFRSELFDVIRRFFKDRGFLEVQTPILSADTVIDRHVEPIAVEDREFPLNGHGNKTYYLQTSPEFAMKRLLAAGLEKIFEITPVFRKGDRGTFHNVEFTMLEWYRVADDYLAGMSLLAELIRAVFHAMQPAVKKEIPRIEFHPFREVFQARTSLNPHRSGAKEFRRVAEENGISYPESYRWDEREDSTDHWVDLLFSELVQPHLTATIVYDYPVSQSQLAQTRSCHDAEGRYDVSERFELFLNGLELANGYHELLDANELRRRNLRTALLRQHDGKPALPEESRLLSAMESGLPASSGTALGLERLLMVMLDAVSIDEVMPFPMERA